MNEDDSENIESEHGDEEQDDDGNETGKEVVNDNDDDDEEDEDAEDIAMEAEAEEDDGNQYAVVLPSILLLIFLFFLLGTIKRCTWRIWKEPLRMFEFLAIAPFTYHLSKISIPTLKKCGVYQADLVDACLKKTYKGLPFLPK
jgi:hypothetical protein